jgi:hypothetical protein
MRLLLDESVPAGLRRSLPGHEMRRVVEIEGAESTPAGASQLLQTSLKRSSR